MLEKNNAANRQTSSDLKKSKGRKCRLISYRFKNTLVLTGGAFSQFKAFIRVIAPLFFKSYHRSIVFLKNLHLTASDR